MRTVPIGVAHFQLSSLLIHLLEEVLHEGAVVIEFEASDPALMMLGVALLLE